jgi:hypothetical protein
MKNLTRSIEISAAPVLIVISFRHGSGFPYLDAGTGSMIIQALIAGSLGAIVAVKLFWNKIKTFFKHLFNKGTMDEEPRA